MEVVVVRWRYLYIVEIMRCCLGVTPRNVKRVLAATRSPEIHMAIMKTIESPMEYRNPNGSYINVHCFFFFESS